MKTPHLISALIAILLFFFAVLGGVHYAESIETRYVHVLAPWDDPHDQVDRQKTLGSALQRAAFRAPDLLPIYGASELANSGAFHASSIFQKYPTGFNIFVVGDAMAEPVIMFQRLAAIGSELRGKKVVITLAPSLAMTKISPRGAYAYNFSPLHAYETAFSTDLSQGLKQRAALRMLTYAETLKKHLLLRFALQKLAAGSPDSLAQYYAVLPLGRLQCAVLELQDHWEMVSYIRTHPELNPEIKRKTQKIDWDMVLDAAQNYYAERSNNNPFGFDNNTWNGVYEGRPPEDQKNWGDKIFLNYMNKTQGWTDLDLLLGALKELGAQTLVLSAPFSGRYFDYVGISPQARSVYYDKLHATAKPYDVWLLDFRDHEQDRDFLTDAVFHVSWPAWVYYSETIDAFYHGTLGVGR